jgi:hypothetical protein
VTTRLDVLAALGLLGAALPALSLAQEEHQPPAPAVARDFAANCASCHVYPDASLETDQAWIRQLQVTA